MRRSPIAPDTLNSGTHEHGATEVLDMMGELKLFGMKGAYDETLATAIKRKHEPQRLVGDLLKAEISEKQARSIRYQLTIAKLPLAKCPSGRFASHLNRLRRGVERLESTVILSAAPLREVPDVDAGEPFPLRPGQVALPK